MNESPKVAVLILNYVTWQQTLSLVADLRRQQGIQLSVLIVDNCSPDDSFARLQEALHAVSGITVVRSDRNGGYAYGNNVGLRHLENWDIDYLVIANNDLRIGDERLLERLVDEHRRRPDAALIAPAMLVDGREDRKHQAWKLPRLRDDLILSLRSLYWLADRLRLTNRYYWPADETGVYQVDCLSGAFFLSRRELLPALGGFDEHTFLYGEENILAHRIRAAGKQNYLQRSCRYEHCHGGTTRRLHRLIDLQRHWLRSASYYHRMYRGGSRAGLILLQLFFFLWLLETTLWEWMIPRYFFRNPLP